MCTKIQIAGSLANNKFRNSIFLEFGKTKGAEFEKKPKVHKPQLASYSCISVPLSQYYVRKLEQAESMQLAELEMELNDDVI